MKSLLFIPGSLRVASASVATIRALTARLPDGVTASVADIEVLPHYNADLTEVPGAEALCDQIRAADGVVFVTPEYNYSIPGVLKNAIDWASRPAFESVFKDKPCFVVTVSGGGLGGARAQAHLKYVLNGMLAQVYPCKEILVPMANAKVTDGVLNDAVILDFAMENLTQFIDGI